MYNCRHLIIRSSDNRRIIYRKSHKRNAMSPSFISDIKLHLRPTKHLTDPVLFNYVVVQIFNGTS